MNGIKQRISKFSSSIYTSAIMMADSPQTPTTFPISYQDSSRPMGMFMLVSLYVSCMVAVGAFNIILTENNNPATKDITYSDSIFIAIRSHSNSLYLPFLTSSPSLPILHYIIYITLFLVLF